MGSSAAADVDGDNDLDLINTTLPALLINNGAGVFSNQTASRMPWFNCIFCGVSFADIDRDNDMDVVCNNAVGINNGAGVFAVGRAISAALRSTLQLAMSPETAILMCS